MFNKSLKEKLIQAEESHRSLQKYTEQLLSQNAILSAHFQETKKIAELNSKKEQDTENFQLLGVSYSEKLHRRLEDGRLKDNEKLLELSQESFEVLLALSQQFLTRNDRIIKTEKLTTEHAKIMDDYLNAINIVLEAEKNKEDRIDLSPHGKCINKLVPVETEDGYAVLLVMKYELMLKNLLERLGYIRSDNQADGNDVYIRAAKCSD